MRSIRCESCAEMRQKDICSVRALSMMVLLAASAVAMAGTHKPLAAGHALRVQASGKATCEQWTMLQMCDVSWYRLLANPNAYRGKIVRLTGYLVGDFGDLIFYPDKADYDAASEIDSIILERPFTVPKAIVDAASSGVYPVTVMGRFKPMAGAAHVVVPRAGTIYDIRKIVSAPRVPSGTPLNMDGIHVQGHED